MVSSAGMLTSVIFNELLSVGSSIGHSEGQAIGKGGECERLKKAHVDLKGPSPGSADSKNGD